MKLAASAAGGGIGGGGGGGGFVTQSPVRVVMQLLAGCPHGWRY